MDAYNPGARFRALVNTLDLDGKAPVFSIGVINKYLVFVTRTTAWDIIFGVDVLLV